MNVHFKTPCWNGTIWKQFFDKPEKRTFLWYWALLCMLFPYLQGRFSFFQVDSSWEKKGQAASASARKWSAQGWHVSEALRGFPLSQLIWVCMLLCTMDFEHLDFYNPVHFHHYSRHFLSEALWFAWEQTKSWEGKSKVKVGSLS